jgi:hypothetical protein
MKEGILRKVESNYGKEPWTITTVHTNGTIRIQHGTAEQNDLVSGAGEYNHLQMIFYKLKSKYVRTIGSIPLSPTLTKSCTIYSILSLHLA